MRVLILGAGPAGLSAAIAMSRLSTPTSPINITVIELRPAVQTTGGSVHMTPQSLQNLDQLGVYRRLKPQGIPVHGIDVISMQTGMIEGTIKKVEPKEDGIVGMRVLRHTVVTTMISTIEEEYSDHVTIRFGMRVTSVHESKDEIVLEFDNGEIIEGDVLLGCDGLHSATRRLYVDPERVKVYSGRTAVIGFLNAPEPSASGVQLANGDDSLHETCIFKLGAGSLLLSFYEPTRSKIFTGSVMPHAEPNGDLRDGWKAIGADLEEVKKHFYEQTLKEDKVRGLSEAMDNVQEWQFWPIYTLNPGGTWALGRAILLGEAAHAMPVQGESIGIAIEDGILLAREFEQHRSKTIGQIFIDYENIRRPVIDVLYESAVQYWNAIHIGSSS
ncbi:FAD/NAD(P)-binding domain-containing protein [Thozetella sp. PMI_491]|nr:FAD/NAD(P)-binding domain-containing protein [Thozetella sp. PMI_491]